MALRRGTRFPDRWGIASVDAVSFCPTQRIATIRCQFTTGGGIAPPPVALPNKLDALALFAPFLESPLILLACLIDQCHFNDITVPKRQVQVKLPQ